MKLIPLVVSIVIAQAVGVIGSVFTAPNVQGWYVNLIRPEWTPPSWLFGPVWITLYTLMGVAAYLVWRRRSTPPAKAALVIYGIHLILNALWSVLFFGFHKPALAFAEILTLLLTILATTFLFWKVDLRAGILFLPYLAWVAFAAFLNYTIWQLN